jgi:hypothetical protein
MATQAELNAQNATSVARQRASRGIEQPAFQVQQPYVNPYGQQYGTDSIQTQGYSNNYDDEGMTEEEWAAYLAGLETPQATSNLVTDSPFASIVEPNAASAPQGEMSPMVRAMLEDRLKRTNADIVASGETVPSLGVAAPQGFKPVGGGFSFGEDTPIPTDRESGFIPAKEEFLTGGTPVFANQGQAPAPVAGVPAAVEMATPESVANLSVNGADVVTPGAITEAGQVAPTAPQFQAPQGLTTAGGQPLAEFLAGGQQLDAQGRMIDPNVDRSDFENESALREQRAAESFSKARGPSSRDVDTGDGAPNALFKKEAEAAGLSGRAKSEFISERSRAWSEAKEDREINQASGQAAGERANLEMGLKIKDWEKTNADERTERVDEMNTEIGALTSIIGQAENISGVAQDAGRQVGAGTTGFFSPLKFIGGTTAADLAGNLETIKSDAFVANITEMRQNSPTGGAVGNVSDKDLEMLQSLQTSFRQNLKPTTLRANLKKYQKIRAKVVADAKKYGQENLNKHFGEQQQAANGGSSAIPNDRNVTTSNNDLYEKHSQ